MTLAVVGKLRRRCTGSDISKFAIQITRKRLLNIHNSKDLMEEGEGIKMEKIERKDSKEVLRNIRKGVLECFKKPGIKITKIILFGSKARGDFSKSSDYDLLIVTEKTFTIKEKMGIAKRVREYLSKYAIDVIIKSEEEIEIQKNQIGNVVREALKEGIKI